MNTKLGHWICLFFLIFATGRISCIEFGDDMNKTINFIIREVNRKNIADNLRALSSRPHVGGTSAEWENAQNVANVWRNQGLDEVHMNPYKVLLSYPKMDKPNYARIHNAENVEIWKSQGRTKPLHSKEEWSKDVFPDFNAYSASGTIKGNVAFINFGGEEDFQRLQQLGVNISGCIAIARYGKAFRANIVKAAEDRGAIGVLLYPDPQQYAQNGSNRVYPDTVFMPGSAAPFGTTKLVDGDPLTPFYPAIESAFRIPEDEAAIPKILVMPISYDDAAVILGKMGGPVAPPDWQGSLNLTYKLGPGLEEQGAYVSMEVNTENEMRTTYNVIGLMKGTVEPDRYVILGNHRDAWIFGAIDPSSATAAMLELTRVLAEYRRRTGWSPRRSLLFCSWGSEEYGLVGSTEWTEQFGKQLADRAIAYLNVDMAIEGNYTLRTKSSPMLYALGREITKMVPNPDPEESKAGRQTVFDTWVLRKPDENKSGFPQFEGIGSGSDYKGFQHNFGVPSLEYRYTHSDEMFAESLYHTLYETFYLVSDLYDKGFNFHAAMTQLWAILATYIADIQVIPFALDEYAELIDDAQLCLYDQYKTLLEERNISYDYFRNASYQFSNATNNYKNIILSLNTSNEMAVRRINDQMMMVERAFIDPQGLPGRPDYNHVVFAPSENDAYSTTAFAGLSDALAGIELLPEEEQEQRWRTFEQHLATCTHFLQTAAKVLSDDLW